MNCDVNQLDITVCSIFFITSATTLKIPFWLENLYLRSKLEKTCEESHLSTVTDETVVKI